jgi:inorganic triphosphatase YgiF
MHDEIELKLSLTADEAMRLFRLPLLRNLATGRARSRQLFTTYYDTPNQALRRNGAALRVRRDGKRLLQTLKMPVGIHGGGRHFREYDSAVDSARPDVRRIDGKLVGSVLDGAKARTLRPVFTTDFERRTLPVRLGDSEIEVALDVGVLRAGRRRAPICEAELELISGNPARLYELALAMQANLPLRIERRTKAARGYGLRNRRKPAVEKWDAVPLSRAHTVREAFPLLARSCIAHVLANVPVVLETRNPAGVHQVRVGLRRLRTLLRVFRPFLSPQVSAHLNAERRWLQRHLGPAREWDVFIAETLDPALAEIVDRTEARAVRRLALSLRNAAYAEARATLRDARLTDFVLRFEAWLDSGEWTNAAAETLDQPVIDLADRALAKCYARTEALAEHGGTLSDEEVHALRIRIKTLRYTADFFASLYDRNDADRLLSAARTIQDILGRFNDAVVGQTQLARLESRAHGRRGSAAVIRHVRGRLVEATACDRDDLVGAWRAIERAGTFW